MSHSIASTRYKSFHSSFHLHDNPLVQALSSLTQPQNPPRRLNRHWPRDFLREWKKVKCIDRMVPVGDYITKSPDICWLFYAYCCRWQNKNEMLKIKIYGFNIFIYIKKGGKHPPIFQFVSPWSVIMSTTSISPQKSLYIKEVFTSKRHHSRGLSIDLSNCLHWKYLIVLFLIIIIIIS
jgi:hypothetical protein